MFGLGEADPLPHCGGAGPFPLSEVEFGLNCSTSQVQ